MCAHIFFVFMQTRKNPECGLLIHPTMINSIATTNVPYYFLILLLQFDGIKAVTNHDDRGTNVMVFGVLNQLDSMLKPESPRKAKILTCFGKCGKFATLCKKLWQICHG